ncbi:hypothetical protein NHQ30_009557 [Ciborinia camelliae]|nr:hypothetical protein NHQ30_009557 [Ciborinia camelliae]
MKEGPSATHALPVHEKPDLLCGYPGALLTRAIGVVADSPPTSITWTLCAYTVLAAMQTVRWRGEPWERPQPSVGLIIRFLTHIREQVGRHQDLPNSSTHSANTGSSMTVLDQDVGYMDHGGIVEVLLGAMGCDVRNLSVVALVIPLIHRACERKSPGTANVEANRSIVARRGFMMTRCQLEIGNWKESFVFWSLGEEFYSPIARIFVWFA